MSQPLDRACRHPQLGKVDREAGEFWFETPFQMVFSGANLSAYERNRLFLNVGGTSFLDASFASRADIDSDSRSVVCADFDRDGREDLLVCSVGGGPLRLFLNRFPQTTHRVHIALVGQESNRSSIGARVVLRCGNRQIVRDLFAANGHTGQKPAELIVGVGSAKQIDRLSIRWPTGRLQEFENLPVDRSLSIIEGRSELSVSALSPGAAQDQ